MSLDTKRLVQLIQIGWEYILKNFLSAPPPKLSVASTASDYYIVHVCIASHYNTIF